MILLKQGQAGQNKYVRTVKETFVGFIFGFCFAFVALWVYDSATIEPIPLARCTVGCTCNKKLNFGTAETENSGNELDVGDHLSRRLKSLERALQNLSNPTPVPLPSDKIAIRRENISAEDEKLHKDDTTVADNLYRKVRVLCWVMTQPANLETRARHIKNTWGKRCHKLLFYSSVTNETFPTIGLNIPVESRAQLNKKTIAAFQHVYKHYGKDYDWFMRTDDDAYVIMENLRYFLSEQDPDGTYYFGHHFKTLVPGGYFSGGPGIVLGREALKRYAAASSNANMCYQGESEADDAELGKCLHTVGIKPGNTTDRLGRSRFHCFDPATHVMKFYPDWFYAYDANGAHGGRDSMSDYAIGFHYVNAVKINELEYYVYHLRPYGVKFADQNLNQKRVTK